RVAKGDVLIGDLKSILRNRLNVVESKKYLKWFSENEVKVGHAHHILESVFGKKLNDLLLVDEPAESHNNLHYGKGETEDEFLDRFIKSLNSLFRYIKYLENNGRQKRN